MPFLRTATSPKSQLSGTSEARLSPCQHCSGCVSPGCSGAPSPGLPYSGATPTSSSSLSPPPSWHRFARGQLPQPLEVHSQLQGSSRQPGRTSPRQGGVALTASHPAGAAQCPRGAGAPSNPGSSPGPRIPLLSHLHGDGLQLWELDLDRASLGPHRRPSLLLTLFTLTAAPPSGALHHEAVAHHTRCYVPQSTLYPKHAGGSVDPHCQCHEVRKWFRVTQAPEEVQNTPSK